MFGDIAQLRSSGGGEDESVQRHRPLCCLRQDRDPLIQPVEGVGELGELLDVRWDRLTHLTVQLTDAFEEAVDGSGEPIAVLSPETCAEPPFFGTPAITVSRTAATEEGQ